MCVCSSLLKDLVYTEAKSIDFIKHSLLYFHPSIPDSPHTALSLPTSTGMNVTDEFTLKLSLSFALSFSLSDALTLRAAPFLSATLMFALLLSSISFSASETNVVKNKDHLEMHAHKKIHICLSNASYSI